MYSDSSYGGVFVVFLMVCLPALCSLSYPQRPDVIVDICSILLQVYPILLISLRRLFFFFFFLYIRSVLDCYLLCFIVNKTIFSQT